MGVCDLKCEEGRAAGGISTFIRVSEHVCGRESTGPYANQT